MTGKHVLVWLLVFLAIIKKTQQNLENAVHFPAKEHTVILISLRLPFQCCFGQDETEGGKIVQLTYAPCFPCLSNTSKNQSCASSSDRRRNRGSNFTLRQNQWSI